MNRRIMNYLVSALAAAAIAMSAGGVQAQSSEPPIQIGLLAPMSGIYARPGAVMKMGAEMAIKDVNDAGGIACMGGAPLQ
ncbi:MAG: ABC transporter substrate-binding protein, partial [Pseudomonadota bacterium]|nr:ABC transporter substrate-binding protein [Pseudomonadota bacterium]